MRPVEEVRLALSPQTLARLLAEKRMSVDDFRCLDQDTKHQVRSIFLRNLRRNLAARQHLCQAQGSVPLLR